MFNKITRPHAYEILGKDEPHEFIDLFKRYVKADDCGYADRAFVKMLGDAYDTLESIRDYQEEIPDCLPRAYNIMIRAAMQALTNIVGNHYEVQAENSVGEVLWVETVFDLEEAERIYAEAVANNQRVGLLYVDAQGCFIDDIKSNFD